MEITMKKIKNLECYVVYAMVTVLTACAANPVENVTTGLVASGNEKISQTNKKVG